MQDVPDISQVLLAKNGRVIILGYTFLAYFCSS